MQTDANGQQTGKWFFIFYLFFIYFFFCANSRTQTQLETWISDGIRFSLWGFRQLDRDTGYSATVEHKKNTIQYTPHTGIDTQYRAGFEDGRRRKEKKNK